MSKDPAFLFYPADASNDVQYMNRLERGAYFDLLKGQRLYDGFTVVQLRKILGNDYDLVWGALELVLEKIDDKYYISWLRESLSKRDSYSQKQKERVQKRWNKTGNTAVLPNNVNENVNENEIRNIDDNENKKVLSKIEIPDENEFITYCEQYLTNIGKNARLYENVLRAKYASWVDQKWKDGNGKKITNWKVKIQNTIPYLKPEYDKPIQVNQPAKKTMLEAQMQTIEAAQILIEKYKNQENDPNALRR